jgi:hypothetical protein
MRKIFLLILGTFLLLAKPALAFCPVCTIAVGAGLGLSRYFGVDDTVSGVWVGALLLSLSFWTVSWFKKKNWNFRGSLVANIVFYYGITIIPLYFTGVMGHPFNRLLGIDKLLLGIVVGSIVFYLAGQLYGYLKKKNNGQAHFPMEKVAMPLVALAIISVVFYFITKY